MAGGGALRSAAAPAARFSLQCLCLTPALVNCDDKSCEYDIMDAHIKTQNPQDVL